MNGYNEFVSKQKKSLLAEREEISKKIKKLKKFPDYGYDEEDNIQELGDFENNISIEEQLNVLVEKIDKALAAIDKGTYGKCAICRQNIEKGRLEIMPYAEICVSCKATEKK